ncbi:MAG: hypothetical protein R2911_39190 [Caldilineaceae bacterium]
MAAAQEAFFLQPLPITLLPLPAKELRWLERLGIRTLGQFGALPTAQVQTALGKAGVAAQHWAQGHDDRPVVHTVTQRFSPSGITFGQPINQLNPVVTALMETLRPHLAALAAACRGVQRLDLALHFGGEERHLALTFVEPTAQEKRIGNHLTKSVADPHLAGAVDQSGHRNLQTAELPPTARLQLLPGSPVSVDSAAECGWPGCASVMAPCSTAALG